MKIMINNVTKSAWVAIAVTFFACTEKRLSVNEEVIHSIDSRAVLRGEPTVIGLSEIADSAWIVRLETRSDVLIASRPNVIITDSLLLVSSGRSLLGEAELFVFDSETGKFKHKIIGFRDRGPLGYRGATSAVHNGKIVMSTGTEHSIWDYTSGKKLDRELSIHPMMYDPLLFLNDSLLIGNVFMVNPE